MLEIGINSLLLQEKQQNKSNLHHRIFTERRVKVYL